MNKEKKQWNCRAGINGWHEKDCPHQKEQGDWIKEFEEKFAGSYGYYNPTYASLIKSFISALLLKEYRKGYNACLKDFKIKNDYGEKSL